MKIQSINQQANLSKQNFKGKDPNKAMGAIAGFVAKHPIFSATTLASSSVVAQKFVMSGSEAVVSPFVDIATGKAITKITNEKDGRTNESSKTQAIRTFAQAVGGTIVGVTLRTACIAATAACIGKAAQKVVEGAGGKIGKIINSQNFDKTKNEFLFQENIDKWAKSIGGFVAIIIMLVTNFVVDPPLINLINKWGTDVVEKVEAKFKKQPQEKEVK